MSTNTATKCKHFINLFSSVVIQASQTANKVSIGCALYRPHAVRHFVVLLSVLVADRFSERRNEESVGLPGNRDTGSSSAFAGNCLR